MKRTSLRRRAPLRAGKPPRRTKPLRRPSLAATDQQRAAVAGRPMTPASLDLLPYLEPAWRAQLAHAVGHVGLIGALRRISGSRTSAPDRGASASSSPNPEPAAAATGMIGTVTIRKSSTWTPEERAREERARTIRARQDRARTPEDRLEDTLRLSKLMSELQQGAARDVPGR